jgi:hypothetical protein
MKVLIENFIEKIETEDAQKALDAVDLIIEKLKTDKDLVAEILDPATITNLHEKLIEHIEVAPRAMQLNRRFPNNTMRAIMFSKAMRNGIAHAQRSMNLTGED